MSVTTVERSAQLWRRTLSIYPGGEAVRPSFRHLTLDDAPALGALFAGAFSGTVDDMGQTEAQYAAKAKAIINGQYGQWIAKASWVIDEAGTLRAACLVCDYKLYGCPVIAIIGTSPLWKRKGEAAGLMDAVLFSLGILGYAECCAMVTIGNAASEWLFKSRGFSPQCG